MLAEATVALNDCTECESNFCIVMDLGGGFGTTIKSMENGLIDPI